MDKIYTAVATVKGGRNGHGRTESGVLDLALRYPKELGGDGGAYTNPEELFALGYAACYNSALMLAAKRMKLNADNAEVKVSISIGHDTDGVGYKLAGRIDVKVSGMMDEEAEHLVLQAHKLCPYSKATRGNVDIDLHYTLE